MLLLLPDHIRVASDRRKEHLAVVHAAILAGGFYHDFKRLRSGAAIVYE
jgi:hypothetical protein